MKTSDELNAYIRDHAHEPDSEVARATGLSVNAVEKRRRRMGVIKKGGQDTRRLAELDLMQKVKDALVEAGVSPDEVGSVKQVRFAKWEMGSKDADGNPQVTPLSGLQLVINPQFLEGPKWPLLDKAKPTKIAPVKVGKRRGKHKIAVILPDPQIGYWRDMKTGRLDPFHDERAMQTALQIVRDLNPDLIVNLGDFLDFAEFSRFEQEVGFLQTTQASIDRAHRFLAEQRANAPHADIRLVEGNHDRRLVKFIKESNMAAFGLKRGNAPDEWPVFSVPYLLRVEELGVQYISGYPAAETWINNRIKCIHGRIVRSGGSTARAVSDDERVSTIFGHVHRIEMHYKTVGVRTGLRTNLAFTPGTLARIDGAVPSTKSSTDLDGRPVMTAENWQQGIGVVYYEEGDGPFSVVPIYIHEGRAFFNGKEYAAS